MGRLRGRVAGRTQYAKSEGVSLAYQVISETGPTLVQIPGAISNIALEDTYPTLCAVLRASDPEVPCDSLR